MSSASAGHARVDTHSTIRPGPRDGPERPSSSIGAAEWESAREIQSGRWSSSVRESLPSSVPSLPSDSLLASSHREPKHLWSAVKTSIKLATTPSPRKRRDGDGGGVDQEGLSGSVLGGSRSSDAHLDQWASIAHYFDDEADGEGDREARGRGALRKRRGDTTKTRLPSSSILPSQQRFLSPERGAAANGKASFIQEPESMVSSDPDLIPRQEDPLAYNNERMLLDTDSDSDIDESDDAAAQGATGKGKGRAAQEWPSLFTKTVIKCVLAYFIASLFTYSPYLSHRMALLLPDHDPRKKVPISNLHLIATVAVYFHPGRSLGGMVESNVYATAAFSYAILLGLSSMLVAVFLHDQQLPLTSNAVSVVFFLGVGLALVGYAKIKIARPTFNTACSLIGLIIFTVLVAEGSTHLGRFSTEKIWQVTLVVLVGVMISNVVCFAIWPVSACTSLQYDIRRNLESFSTLLKVLTKTFLLDDVQEFNIRSDRIKTAIDNHHSSFISLKNNLAEAKLEVPFDVRIRGRVSSYVRVVNSLNTLAQHLGGLRSSCSLQHEIIVAHRARHREERAQDGANRASPMPPSSTDSALNKVGTVSTTDFDDRYSAFGHFLETVGPHMRSLVVSAPSVLLRIRSHWLTSSRPSLRVAAHSRA